MMEKNQHSTEIEEQDASKFNLGNFFFGVLGAWCAVVVCLMVTYTGDPDRSNRNPAQEPAPAATATPSHFDERAYFLSFNSIHLEK